MKKTMLVMAMVIALALSTMATAMAQTTVTDSASDQACFGQWRASSVQDLTDEGHVVGRDFFSVRAGNNASINEANKVQCGAANR